MPRRVNAPAVLVLLVLAASGGACTSAPRSTGAGSRIEVEWLEPPSEPDPAAPARPTRPILPGPELGDGSAPSEMLAGARRLLGLEIARDAFVRHVLAGALIDEAALAPASHPAVGDLARGADVLAVVERLDTVGPGVSVVLVGLRDAARVGRWTTPARGLAFARAPAPR